jgi:putative flippase GtrA
MAIEEQPVEEQATHQMPLLSISNTPTIKRPAIRQPVSAPADAVTDVSERPTLRMRAVRFVQSQPMLFAVSGVTPVPADMHPETMINAAWFRWLYARLDRMSHGQAAKIAPLLSFLIVGGTASIVNLAIVFLCDLIDRTHHNDLTRHIIYSALATEISLLYNFALNDRFTFRSLVDRRRRWWQRCLRFHIPASVGFIMTLGLSSLFFTMTTNVPYHSILSQALAILIVTAVNFLMHRFWTYRPVKAATSQ